jgi:predicted nucleotidyltransferase
MAERIAAAAGAERFGVRAFYLFGSAKNGTAGPGSDINVLVHFSGTEAMRKDLLSWLEGWSLCLAEANYLRTGVKTEGLLDVHIVTGADLESPTGVAAKIGAVTDAARSLPIRPSSQ